MRPRLVEADRRKHRREPDETRRERPRQPDGVRRPRDDRQQRREREDEEEQHDRAFLGVERPQQGRRCPGDERRGGRGEPEGDRRELFRPKRANEQRERRGGEHDVERQEEEGVLATELDGNAERRSEEQRYGHDARPAHEGPPACRRRDCSHDEGGDPGRGCEPLEVVPRKERDDQHRLRGGEQEEPGGELDSPGRAEDDQRRACGPGQRGNLGKRLVRHRGL